MSRSKIVILDEFIRGIYDLIDMIWTDVPAIRESVESVRFRLDCVRKLNEYLIIRAFKDGLTASIRKCIEEKDIDGLIKGVNGYKQETVFMVFNKENWDKFPDWLQGITWCCVSKLVELSDEWN